jgi:hypothetical protein
MRNPIAMDGNIGQLVHGTVVSTLQAERGLKGMGEGMKEEEQTLEYKIGRTEEGKRGTVDSWDWQICISILIQGKFMGICPHQMMSALRSDM